jgi:electron transfer flavoprotein alpha subunit
MTGQTRDEVWVVADHRGGQLEDTSLELLGEGRSLADRLGVRLAAVALGEGIGALAQALGERGADRVYLADDVRLRERHPDIVTTVLADAIRSHSPSTVLFCAGRGAREVAPRVAARLNTGLASECTKLDLDAQGHLVATHPVYGGKVSCIVVCPETRPQMATFQPGFGAKRGAAAARQADVVPVELPAEAGSPRTAVERAFRDEPGSMDLADADVIVAGGRGMRGPEGFRLLEELAELLGGAVAASRVAVDGGWVPAHRQVGLSGRTVTPRLYIACGISGVVHHVMGMKDSKAIIAINRDRHAPIVKLADLAIVGDVFEVVPVLLERVRRRASQRGPAGDPLQVLGGL